MDKRFLGIGLIGGIAVLGYLLLSKQQEMVLTGSGAAGQSSGYEGGSEIPWNLIFGGETINFPPPEQQSIADLLPPMPTGDGGKKATSAGYLNWGPKGGLTLVGIDVWNPEKAEIAKKNKEQYGIPEKFQGLQDGQSGSASPASSGGGNDLLTALGIGLGFVGGPFGSIFGLASVATGGTGKKADIASSGGSGSGTIGSTGGGYTGSSGWVAPAPVAILGQGSKKSGSGSTPGEISSYFQQKYGSSSKWEVRGYSITGIPLYKPAGT